MQCTENHRIVQRIRGLMDISWDRGWRCNVLHLYSFERTVLNSGDGRILPGQAPRTPVWGVAYSHESPDLMSLPEAACTHSQKLIAPSRTSTSLSRYWPAAGFERDAYLLSKVLPRVSAVMPVLSERK